MCCCNMLSFWNTSFLGENNWGCCFVQPVVVNNYPILLWIIDSCFESGRYIGYTIFPVSPIYISEDCQIVCQEHPDCRFWSYYHSSDYLCYLHDGNALLGAKPSNPPYYTTRGPQFCQGKQIAQLSVLLKPIVLYL